MTEARDQLRALMSLHKLSPAKVGDMLGVSVATVNTWTSRAEGEGRDIPGWKLELLKLKLEKRS